MISLVETFLKARYGRYANTAENRRLHRVGQEYGHRAIDTDDDEEYLANVEGLTKTEQRLQRLEKYRNKYNELVLKTRELAAKNDPKRFVYQEAAEKLYDRIKKLSKRIGAKALAKEAEKGRKSQNQTECDNAWGTGAPMEFEKANGKRCNPYFDLNSKYGINCQSCVVAYELRRRGYNVEARPYTTDAQKYLAHWNQGAFLNPDNSYAQPAYYYGHIKKDVADWFETTTSEKGRYVYSFTWRKSSRARKWHGHIISVDRLEDSKLRIYDPQTGQIWNRFDDFLMYYDRKGGFGFNRRNGVLRTDNKEVNVNFVKDVVKGATPESETRAKQLEQTKPVHTDAATKILEAQKARLMRIRKGIEKYGGQFMANVVTSDRLKWFFGANKYGLTIRDWSTLTMDDKGFLGLPVEKVIHKMSFGWWDKATGEQRTGRVYVGGDGVVYAIAKDPHSDNPKGVPFTKLNDKLW